MMTTSPKTSMHFVRRLRNALRPLWRAGGTRSFLSRLPPPQARAFARDFVVLAHAHQEPPARANNGGPWTTWLVLGGRGAGKTRLGAEWVRALAHGTPPYAAQAHGHIALVGETLHDARAVMIEGPAGLLASSPR